MSGAEFSKEDIVGVSNNNIFNRKEYNELLNIEKKVIASGESINNARITIPNTHGNQIGLVNIIPRFNEENLVTEIVVTIKDITEISVTIDRLNHLKEAVNSLDEMIFIRSRGRSSEYFYISDSCFKIYGRSKEEFLEDPELWHNVIIDEDKSKIKRASEEAIKIHEPLIYRIKHKDGRVRWVRREIFYKIDDFGDFLRFGTLRDITDVYK